MFPTGEYVHMLEFTACAANVFVQVLAGNDGFDSRQPPALPAINYTQQVNFTASLNQ